MDKNYLKDILNRVASGELAPEAAADRLKTLPFDDMDFANIDYHRALRTGYPEVVFCQGKTTEQIAAILKKLAETNETVFGTRATPENFAGVKAAIPEAVYYEDARIIAVSGGAVSPGGHIAVVSAGTADIPVAEEAAVTAELLGNTVDRIYDVGVAGIHRLFAKLDRIRAAEAVIVVAGMEGALASVVGGLVEAPVVAVPTSVGYGANLGGLSALLSMLNSCANGVGIVNIDNGFGAGYLASLIVKRPRPSIEK